jgi:hypothetical protein
MICNRCVKQDVCVNKYATEILEQHFLKACEVYGHIKLDCRHREPATDAQMNKIKERAEY